MSETFIKPVRFGEMKTSIISPKTATLKSYPNDKIYAPYTGVVVYNPTPTKDCSNEILIHHIFRDDSVYSQFCNAKKVYVSNGDNVRQGDMIGEFGDEDITYVIKNKKDSKLELQPFFTSQEKSKEEPVGKKEDKKKEKEKEVEPVKKKKDTGNDYDKKFNNKKGYQSSGNVFLDTLLLPFAPTDMILGRPDETNEELTEEIQRIKKIIKH